MMPTAGPPGASPANETQFHQTNFLLDCVPRNNAPPAPCCQARGLGVVLLYTHSTVEGMVRNLKKISGSVEELLRLRE